MPYARSRRYSKRRPMYRRRRRFVRKSRINRSLQYHLWKYKRSAALTIADTSSCTLYQIDATADLSSTSGGIWYSGVLGAGAPVAGTPYYYAMSVHPALELLPNYTEYTALYDQYKVRGVSIKLTPMANTANTGTSATVAYGQTGLFVHSCIDYDGGAIPTTAGAATIDWMKQYTNYKVKRMTSNKSLRYYIVPKTRLDAEATTNVVLTKRPMWMDVTTTNIGARQLNLLFEVIPNISDATQYVVFRVDVVMYLSFKGQR